jgi:hypothetical protein
VGLDPTTRKRTRKERGGSGALVGVTAPVVACGAQWLGALDDEDTGSRLALSEGGNRLLCCREAERGIRA